MQPGDYNPWEKQIKCLERGRTNNPEVPMNKCKKQKENLVLSFPVQQCPKAAPSYCRPLAVTGGLLRRKDKPSWLRQISTGEVGDRRRVVGRSKVVIVVRRIARALLAEFTHTPLPSFPTPANRLPRKVRVGCRHELAELPKARLRTGIQG
jgi:hypothetical protein